MVAEETLSLTVPQLSAQVTMQKRPHLPPAKKLSRVKRKAEQRVHAKLS